MTRAARPDGLPQYGRYGRATAWSSSRQLHDLQADGGTPRQITMRARPGWRAPFAEAADHDHADDPALRSARYVALRVRELLQGPSVAITRPVIR
ncbi:MAG TPA: hypothetical protein VHU91_03235 [Mycobacteriales bacterium]|nr:hypothetical protein [Mycobacteriales bacterium]